MAAFGLRAKSLLLIGLVSLLVLVTAGFAGWRMLEGVQAYFGEAYARNTTALGRERILAPISRELALARRFAALVTVREWLADEGNPEKTRRAAAEIETFRQGFHDRLVFLGSAATHNYYVDEQDGTFAATPAYTMDPARDTGNWFFSTLAAPAPLNINVDPDKVVRGVKIWFNVVVEDNGRRLGVAGSGIDLTRFLADYLTSLGPGVTPMVINEAGAIQVHPDANRVAYNSGAGTSADPRTNLTTHLAGPAEVAALRAAMARATADEGRVELLRVRLEGAERLLALAHIQETGWYVVNAFDTDSIRPAGMGGAIAAGLALAGLLIVVVVGVGVVVTRMVLVPLSQLERGAREVARGHYDVALPEQRGDEIGDLSRAFLAMARRVRHHTEELESRVRERTRELEQTNQRMAVAQKHIADSLDYASLIQRSLLPPGWEAGEGMERAALWLPKDVVGGDFHIRRDTPTGTLFGVFDCAGHGVPGALMTMLAHAALGQAMAEIGAEDPSALLRRLDSLMRAALPRHAGGAGEPMWRDLATNVDAALVHIDSARRRLSFAGAKIDLYSRPAGESVAAGRIERLPAVRRALADRKTPAFANATLALEPGQCVYLVSDGVLDQAGGVEGFGFGRQRLVDMIARHGHLPPDRQVAAFEAELAAYRGPRPQRDDITLVCVRVS